MGIGDIVAALGGVAALVAAGTFIGKLVLEKFAEGALRRFEHSMTIATEVHKAELVRQADAFKSFVGFSAAIDTDLRQRRVDIYGELWKLTALASMWPRNTDLEYEQVAEFSRLMRKWYFEKGGMFLSESARGAYGEVQKTNHALIEKKLSGKVADTDYDSLRGVCSALRTALTVDLRSRGEMPVEPAGR